MTLRRLVKDTTGQDVYLCRGCQDCDLPHIEEQDIPLGSLVQMILFDDEEVLTSRTLWSEKVLADAARACVKSNSSPCCLGELFDWKIEAGYSQPARLPGLASRVFRQKYASITSRTIGAATLAPSPPL